MGIQVRETLRFAMPVFFVLASLTLLGCASTSPYLSSSVDTRVELGESRLHEFTYVRVYQEGDDLVVYGRVEHSHGYCPAESHVDLAVLGSQQEVLETTSIPIVNRGTRRRGW